MLKNGFKTVWLFQLLCLGSMLIISPIFACLDLTDSQNATMFSELIMIFPCIIGCIVLYKKQGSLDLKKDFALNKIKSEYLLYVILMPVFYQIFCVYMTMPVSLGMDILFGSDTPDIETPSSVFGYICTILGLCVFAPVLEEFIFRGIMVKFMKNFSFQAVMLTTSLAFSMLHMDMSGFVQIFFLGMFLFLLRTATDSLFSSITAHAIINFVSFISMLIMNSGSPEKFQAVITTIELGSLIVMPMLMVNFLRVTSAGSKWTHKYRLKGQKPGVSPALIIFTAIYIIWNIAILADNISSGYTKKAIDELFSDEIVSGEELT